MLIGFHIPSEQGGVIEYLKKVQMMGGNLVQLFIDPYTTNPHNYKMIGLWLRSNHIKCVVHISYVVNLGQQWDEYSFHIKQFVTEIKIAGMLKAFAVVVHLGKYSGKHIDIPIDEALNNMYSSLIYVHNETKDMQSVKILLETSPGQSNDLCPNIVDLAYFFKKFSENKSKDVRNRFGICVDTCHIFASGIDIRTHSGVAMFFEQFRELFGWEYLKLVHLNDSYGELFSHIDHHAGLGKGYIGKDALIYFARMATSINTPIILETPMDNIINDTNEVLIGVASGQRLSYLSPDEMELMRKNNEKYIFGKDVVDKIKNMQNNIINNNKINEEDINKQIVKIITNNDIISKLKNL
jgi:deoxyribonuclease-4